MALTLNKSLDLTIKVWTSAVQQLRYRNRPNFKRPLPLHFKRKRILAVSEPVLAPKPKICDNLLTTKTHAALVEDNPYAVFLAGQMRRDFAKYPMIAMFHTNHYTQHEFMKIRGLLFDANFPMKFQDNVNSRIAKYSLEGTRWAPVLQLCVGRTSIGYCTDPDIPKLLKVLKKMPQFLLLGLIYENQLLHRDDIERVAKFPNLLSLQWQVSTTLNLPGMTLSQSLLAGQIALSHSLSTLTKDLVKDDTSSSSSSSDSSSSSGSDSD